MTEIPNFYRISESIMTGGQPAEHQFSLIRAQGISTVINLAPKTSRNAIPHEEHVVTSLDMSYVHIPVDFDRPTENDLNRFFDSMNSALTRGKVFVHCVMNYRVSAFIYLYRVNILNEDHTIAENAMESVWHPDLVWKAFVEDNIR